MSESVEPLIYTTKGNVPIASLTYSHEWEVTEDHTIFKESWIDQTGEVVKNNCHVHVNKVPTLLGGEQFQG